MRRNKSRQHLLLAPPEITESGGQPAILEAGGFRWSGERGEIVFPHYPKPLVIALGQWPARDRLVEDAGRRLFGLYRAAAPKTQISHCNRIVVFLKWVAEWDASGAVRQFDAMSGDVIHGYLDYLKGLSVSYSTKMMYWGTFRKTVEATSGHHGMRGRNYSSAIAWPANPFAFSRRHLVPTEPLTVEEVSSLLKLCEVEAEAIWATHLAEGANYQGPTIRDLTPYLCLVGLITGMNPDTLRRLRVSQMGVDGLGRNILRGSKPRAGRDQQATLPAGGEDALDGNIILDRLLTLTAPLRWQAPADMNDFLWIGWVKSKGPQARRISSLKEQQDNGSPAHIGAFGDRAGIADLTLRRLRATVAELARVLDGGISVTALLGNSILVAENNYKSPGAIAREKTALAKQMEARWRFNRSNGKSDVRDRPGAPQSAATPGFSCADPFSPPPEVWPEPGMCASFLACPTCPLAGLNVDSAEAASDLLHLRLALNEARHRLPPARWRQSYQAPFELIGECLGRMNSAIVEAAANFPPRPIPDLE